MQRPDTRHAGCSLLFRSLWNTLRTADERESGMGWLLRCAFPKRGARSLCFTPTICRWVFDTLVCAPLNLRCLAAGGFDCFTSYFVGINKAAGKVAMFHPGEILLVHEYDLHGWAPLWDIILTASDTVACEAVSFLLVLHEKLSTGHRRFLNRVVDRVLGQLHSASLTLAAKSTPPAAQERAIASAHRCVYVLQRVLAADGSASKLQNHATAGRGAAIKVTVFVNENYKVLESETFELLLHSKETLSSLREKAIKALKVKSE